MKKLNTCVKIKDTLQVLDEISERQYSEEEETEKKELYTSISGPVRTLWIEWICCSLHQAVSRLS